ncbi:PRAME family member 8-like [Thomomys bottae]
MGTRSPSKLWVLAMRSLLKDQGLAISALQVLPWNLFPKLLIVTVVGGHMAVLKALVSAWPFPYLPMGSRWDIENMKALRAILEGLDMLLEQDMWPRCKLRVIHLRERCPSILGLGYIELSRACSALALIDKPAANHHPEMTEEPPFRIFLHVVIDDGPLDCGLAHLLQWAKARTGRVQLCCKKLQILSPLHAPSTSKLHDILPWLHLDSIQELLVEDFWHHRTEENIVPYLVQMKNLRSLTLSQKRKPCEILVYEVTPLLHLEHHQVSQMDEDVILYEKLHEALRNVYVVHFSPGPLRALLEKVAGTLESLAIEHCEIHDAQLSAMLPTLSQCSQLSLFSFFGNPISMAALQNLLRHTARLSQLSEGLYPAPLESYDQLSSGHRKINKGRLAQVCESLLPILRDIQPAHEVHISTYSCDFCEIYHFHSLAPSGNWEDSLEKAEKPIRMKFIPLTTMSFPTLRQLGVERLLEDPALAMSALEVLPCNLFVPFLEEVVVKSLLEVQKGTDGWKGMKEVLRATVQAWPFPCLPLGDLLCRTDRDIMAVILETLDMLLEQEVWPR